MFRYLWDLKKAQPTRMVNGVSRFSFHIFDIDVVVLKPVVPAAYVLCCRTTDYAHSDNGDDTATKLRLCEFDLPQTDA